MQIAEPTFGAVQRFHNEDLCMRTFVSAALLGALALSPLAALAADAPPTVGATAPGFTLPSQLNKPVSLSDFKGQWVVLYFYPKDMTPGCTVEAHNFQRDEAKFKALNAVVVGVSFNTVAAHQQFCTKETLSFKLLADPVGNVISEYGVKVSENGGEHFADRETFLISPDGKVAKVWTKVNAQSHSAEVLDAIKSAEGK